MFAKTSSTNPPRQSSLPLKHSSEESPQDGLFPKIQSPNDPLFPKIQVSQQAEVEVPRRNLVHEHNRRVVYCQPYDQSSHSTNNLKQNIINKQILSSSKGHRKNYN